MYVSPRSCGLDGLHMCVRMNLTLVVAQMQALLPEETFQKYQQFSFLARLRVGTTATILALFVASCNSRVLASCAYVRTCTLEPNCRWCPKPGCETAIIASNDSNTVVCTKCAYSFCKQCAGDSHEGSSCKQAARAARSNEKASVRRQRRQYESSASAPMSPMTCTDAYIAVGCLLLPQRGGRNQALHEAKQVHSLWGRSSICGAVRCGG